MPAPLPNAEAGIAPDTPSLNRRDDIQGLRAVAVLMVVAFHAGLPIPGGFIGVDVFFVISGFVITAMLYRESLQIGRIRFGRFYFRRFKRLTPALALTVSVVVVVSALVLSPIGAQVPVAQTAVGAMFLVANYVIARYSGGYFETGAEKNPLLHTWSLSVEEQFYLIFPALIALGWHLARRRGLLRFTPVLVVGGVAVASFSLALAGSMGLTFTGSRFVLGFYSPFTRAWEFAAGALLALAFNRGLRARRTMTVLGLIGAALLAASLWFITGTTPFPGVWTLLPVCGTLLLLIAGTSPEAPTTRLLSTLPAVRIGDWSYSIYLWHWPFIVFAALIWPESPGALLTAAALSFAPALASYRWVETPIRSTAFTDRRRFAALASATFLVPVALSTTQDLWIPSAFQSNVATFVSDHRVHTAFGKCLSTATMEGPTGKLTGWGSCTWNAGARGVPLYLVGDSSAGMLTETLEGAANSLGSPLTLDAAAACPLVDWYRSGGDPDPASAPICREHVEETLRNLESATPGVVVLANSDVYVWLHGYLVGDEWGALSSDPEQKATIWKDGLRKVVERLQSHGHKVVLVQPVHRFEAPYFWDPAACTRIRIAQDDCEASMPLSYIDHLQRLTRGAVDELARELSFDVIDLRPLLCDASACETRRSDGLALYGDRAHISVPFALDLIPRFTDALARLIR